MTKFFAIIALLAGISTTHAKDYFDQADQVTPLLPGMKMPEVTVYQTSGKPFQFKTDNIEKPFVLTFYRGGWCPYCNAYLGEMKKAEKALIEMGFDVYFISPERPELLKEREDALKEMEDLEFTLLSDAGMDLAKAYRIAFKLDAETQKKYLGYGININEASGFDHQLLPVPATFLVDTKGDIQFSYVNPNYTIRLAPEILLAAAKDLLKRQPKS